MSITTIIGPMFSGKTTELIRLIDRKVISGQKCLIIKHLLDNRYTCNIDNINDIINNRKYLISHSNFKYDKCDIMALSDEDLSNNDLIEYIVMKYNTIGIDEGFLFKNIKDFSNILANKNRNVVVATLDGSYKQEPFLEISKLIVTSDIVIKLYAVCMQCGCDGASYTMRINDNGQDILIGGAEYYKSVCRKCLLSNKF